MTTQMSVADLVERYQQLKQKVDELKVDHAAELMPFEEGMQKVATALEAFMHQSGQTSLKTDHGKVTMRRTDSFKVAPGEEGDPFFEWVVEGWPDTKAYLNRVVNTPAARELYGETEETPPGIRRELQTKMSITKN